MIGLQRVPPAVGQGLAVVGLATCFLGVALPHLRTASGEGARAELAESEAYLEARVAEFARTNQLSPNHSVEVKGYRARLIDDLDIPELRRSAAAHAGSDKRTPLAPLLVFAGLALLALGCLAMIATATTGHAIWALLLIVALAAGGVGLAHPEARAVPSFDGADQMTPAQEPDFSALDDRRLCQHLLAILFSGDKTNLGDEVRDEFLEQCVEALAKKPPTAEQRRCVMRARTADDLEACNLK